MAASDFQPIPFPAEGPIYLKLLMPKVPWWYYNDHVDGYFPYDDADASMLVLDLAANPSNGGILLGGVDVPLAQPETDENQDQGADPAWKGLKGARGWHCRPETIQSFVQYAARAAPSLYFRTVAMDADYAIRATSPTRYELSVKVKSIVGASLIDTDNEYGRSRLSGDSGVFKLVLARDGRHQTEWSVVGAERVEFQSTEAPGAAAASL
ncbi:hypothetical protein B0T14DRAFT_513491 [Immersiella caudata]|uniref:Uncharacterized protein n=1 Tax=Immersiella caudata TaxID=314043 RepID=A0AA40C899_9PEZI|nr:hypothetical protein B0T14DRAFT_513491 [Immersiella caudata]